MYKTGGVNAIRNIEGIGDFYKTSNIADDSAEALSKLKSGLDNLTTNPNPIFQIFDFDKTKFLEAASEFISTKGVGSTTSGPLYDFSRGNGVGPYVELVGTKGLKDKGHNVLEFDNKTFIASDNIEFDIDSITQFSSKIFANQAKASLVDPERATIFATRMSDWISVSPSERVGQFIVPEANPLLFSREAYDAIKAVNPDIRIVDIKGNILPRP